MPAASIPVFCRTVVIVGFLAALALGGTPGLGTAGVALALVAVWVAPLVVAHGRRSRLRSALGQPAAERSGAVAT